MNNNLVTAALTVALLAGCSTGPSEVECEEANAIAVEYIENVRSILDMEDVEQVTKRNYHMAALIIDAWPSCFSDGERRWAHRQLRSAE